jgi:hypothetical protein
MTLVELSLCRLGKASILTISMSLSFSPYLQSLKRGRRNYTAATPKGIPQKHRKAAGVLPPVMVPAFLNVA